MKYRFTGMHANAITAALTGDGKAKLKKWRDAASFGANESVWLCDTDKCDVKLVLTDALVDSPESWQGELFVAPGACLDVVVEADSPEACHAVLADNLFSRFDGQREACRASFPVWAGPSSVAPERYSKHRVLVAQATTDLEYLTVSVRPEDAPASAWIAVAP